MLKKLSVLAIALFATQSYAATVNQFFVDIGAGQSKVADYCEPIEQLKSLGAQAECEDKDTFIRIGAGVMLSPNLSAEVSYLELGEVQTNAAVANIGFSNDRIKAQTVALQLGAYAPIAPELTVYGKLGAAYTNIQAEYAYRVRNVNTNITEFGMGDIDESEFEAIVSAGASYNVMPNVGVNIQLDYIPNIGTEETGEADITAISAGLKYQF